MYGNNNFRGASVASTPQFASAAARQGQLDQTAQQQENSQLSNNLMGAGALYNEGMGDRSPIADFLLNSPEQGMGGAGTEMLVDPAALQEALRSYGANLPEQLPEEMINYASTI